MPKVSLLLGENDGRSCKETESGSVCEDAALRGKGEEGEETLRHKEDPNQKPTKKPPQTKKKKKKKKKHT